MCAALRRALSLWFRGEAFGIPLAILVTRRNAYETLTRTGKTTWDAMGGFVVSHDKVGRFRIAIAIMLLVAYFAFNVWLQTAA